MSYTTACPYRTKKQLVAWAVKYRKFKVTHARRMTFNQLYKVFMNTPSSS